jgi:hypothetical protein
MTIPNTSCPTPLLQASAHRVAMGPFSGPQQVLTTRDGLTDGWHGEDDDNDKMWRVATNNNMEMTTNSNAGKM